MILPAPRLVLYLALASLLLLLSPLSPALVGIATGANLLLLVAVLWDALQLRSVHQCRVHRDTLPVHSLGVDNPVQLWAENPTNQALMVELFDAWPPELSGTPSRIAGPLAAHGCLSGIYRVLPERRGDFAYGDIVARFSRPTGLLVRQVRYPAATTVRVFPNVQDIRKHQLLESRNHLHLMGVHRRRQADVSLEFDSLKEYGPDDDPRRIDWKASARHREVLVRQYQAERSQSILLLLDCGRMMASRLEHLSKLDHAINTCLMLTYVAAHEGDRVGMLAFDTEVLGFLPPGKGREQSGRASQFLYRLEAHRNETDFRTAFARLSSLWKRRSLVIIFTDLVDPEASSNLLRHVGMLIPKHKVLCVALSDYELDGVMATVPTDTRSMYEQAAAAVIRADRAAAIAVLRSRGVQSLDASPNTLTTAVLNRYLALKSAGW